ncbi:MAG: adenylosuccinate lyase [Bacteroidales bacterium]|nr:adenylosuccinate lyase [Bacteroidales bacterium]MDD2241632.1 adenylosuccinate lyase [Bacteroidales bacterium]MDD3910904.1 adenylosuccinate lyase [Bacteroidales bacterium]MDD4419976.1 adenylosuccinate lyase [Bacteroidales bacterium]
MAINTTALTAVSPVDGRYRNKVEILSEYFSEYALIKYRVRVEIEYFISLCNIPLPQLKDFKHSNFEKLKDLYRNFTPQEAAKVKDIEKITNHDVKAVEYYIKDEFKKLKIEKYQEFVHFGLTSQDINNTATPLSLKEGISAAYMPAFEEVEKTLKSYAKEWKDVPMLAHTHGQPASPTRLGKEIEVFVSRIDEQRRLLKTVPYCSKFGGATGNFNAHFLAYPKIDWNKFAKDFQEKTFGLKRSYPTTQIEHYDDLAALFDNLRRINTILIDLCRDMWTYISMEYFKQKIKAGEIGSSAMPHKVNPIDFENAEGNFGMANAIFTHLAMKLPISRMQRDLTDSTVLRNIGVPIAHSIIAFKSLKKGLGKLILNDNVIERDLDNNWAVVSEGIQTILRREGYPHPYEALKELTRVNTKISKESIRQFVNNLNVSEAVKRELLAITPRNYTGK